MAGAVRFSVGEPMIIGFVAGITSANGELKGRDVLTFAALAQLPLTLA